MNIGLTEGIIIALVIVAFFLVPKQLPKIGKAIGDTIREVRGIQKELEK